MDAKLSPKLISDFSDFKVLGHGAYGVVIRAKHKNEDYFTAIKIMRATNDGKVKPLDEVAKLASIGKHDSVVSLVDYWAENLTQNDHQRIKLAIGASKRNCNETFHYPESTRLCRYFFIRMEYCDNGNLHEWIRKRKTSMCVSTALSIFLQIARGLEHIHANNIIHRDLKPSNILIHGNMAKIADLGWAVCHESGDYSHTGQAGACLYRSPEQDLGKYGKSADYYALGFILYQLFNPSGWSNAEHCLLELKYNGGKCSTNFKKAYPIVAALVERLISFQPNLRPNPSEVVRQLSQMIELSISDEDKIATMVALLSFKTCGCCKKKLHGIWYKCSVCVEFYLCSDCEETDYDHNPRHNFLKIRNRDGCKHYQRKCELQCPACNKFYPCRVCHDDIEAHNLNRFIVKTIKCGKCGLKQIPRRQCLYCNIDFAKYFCSICNLYDDCEDADQLIFHCHKCGICRRKQYKSIDYVHCQICSMCYPKTVKLENGEMCAAPIHSCTQGAGMRTCNICDDDMHDSREAAVLMTCGHYIHQKCKESLPIDDDRCC